MKYLIFDSGALINITTNGLIETLKDLSTIFQGEFIITKTVNFESIERPMNIKKFEWGALRIKQLLDEDIILEAEGYLVGKEELRKRTDDVIKEANNLLFSENQPIHLIERGEAECLALAEILSERDIECAVVIDERTARMMCESPENLRKLMEEKLKTKLGINEDIANRFKKIKVIRSTEIIYIAYKKGVFDSGEKKTIEAVLYALKYHGCSISNKEIETMKNL